MMKFNRPKWVGVGTHTLNIYAHIVAEREFVGTVDCFVRSDGEVTVNSFSMPVGKFAAFSLWWSNPVTGAEDFFLRGEGAGCH